MDSLRRLIQVMHDKTRMKGSEVILQQILRVAYSVCPVRQSLLMAVSEGVIRRAKPPVEEPLRRIPSPYHL